MFAYNFCFLNHLLVNSFNQSQGGNYCRPKNSNLDVAGISFSSILSIQ